MTEQENMQFPLFVSSIHQLYEYRCSLSARRRKPEPACDHEPTRPNASAVCVTHFPEDSDTLLEERVRSYSISAVPRNREPEQCAAVKAERGWLVAEIRKPETQVSGLSQKPEV